MRILSLALLIAAVSVIPGPVGAQDEQQEQDEAPEATELRELAQSGQLRNLQPLLGDEQTLQTYARAVARLNHSKEGRKKEWMFFDRIVQGPMQDFIRRLPPEQWTYVSFIEEHRRIVYGAYGNGIVGNITQSFGNVFLPEKDRIHIKCYERADQLISHVHGVNFQRLQGTSGRWSDETVTANQGRLNEHTAACFTFRGSGAPMDLIADPWANVMLPAESWWRNVDPKYAERLAANGASARGWCGENYRAVMDDMDQQYKKVGGDGRARLEKLRNSLGGLGSPSQ